MMPARAWAVILVKPFRLAKRRLRAVLDAGERIELARTMLEDVLDIVTECRSDLAGTIVVTADRDAAALARRRGVVVLDETIQAGMNVALERATGYVAGASDDGVVVIPADLPHVSPRAIATMLDLLREPRAVALVQSTDGGTNMLACRPADVIRPAFGVDSCRRHCEAARRAGIRPAILAGFDMERDIDRPGDLAAFLSLRSATRTDAYLTRLGVAARLRAPMAGGQAGTRSHVAWRRDPSWT